MLGPPECKPKQNQRKTKQNKSAFLFKNCFFFGGDGAGEGSWEGIAQKEGLDVLRGMDQARTNLGWGGDMGTCHHQMLGSIQEGKAQAQQGWNLALCEFHSSWHSRAPRDPQDPG